MTTSNYGAPVQLQYLNRANNRITASSDSNFFVPVPRPHDNHTDIASAHIAIKFLRGDMPEQFGNTYFRIVRMIDGNVEILWEEK